MYQIYFVSMKEINPKLTSVTNFLKRTRKHVICVVVTNEILGRDFKHHVDEESEKRHVARIETVFQ